MASLFCVFSVDHQRLPFLWQGLFPEWEFGAVYVFVLLQSICRCFVYSHSWLTWRFLSFISYPFRILLCWPLFFACKCRFFYCPGPISMYSFTDVFFFFSPLNFICLFAFLMSLVCLLIEDSGLVCWRWYSLGMKTYS